MIQPYCTETPLQDTKLKESAEAQTDCWNDMQGMATGWRNACKMRLAHPCVSIWSWHHLSWTFSSARLNRTTSTKSIGKLSLVESAYLVPTPQSRGRHVCAQYHLARPLRPVQGLRGPTRHRFDTPRCQHSSFTTTVFLKRTNPGRSHSDAGHGPRSSTHNHSTRVRWEPCAVDCDHEVAAECYTS